MTSSNSSLAALLLTNRLVDVGAKPLTAAEYWAVLATIADPAGLLGVDAVSLASMVGDEALARRMATLLGASTAFAFERERMTEEGIAVVSTFDAGFPRRLVERLRVACPAFLTVAGPIEWLSAGGLGVVGSRTAGDEALEVARAAAGVAVRAKVPVISGLAREIDRASMAAAVQAQGAVIGVGAEGLRVTARNPEVRRSVHAGELCIVSPYAPAARFSASNAHGRNKIVYALADVTLVVCADDATGGTWDGAKEALARGFGAVGVWTGTGEGPGNNGLTRLGGTPVKQVATTLDVPMRPVEHMDQSAMF